MASCRGVTAAKGTVLAAPKLLQSSNIEGFSDVPRRTRLRLDSVDRVRRELIKLYRQGRDGERGADDVAKLAGVLGIVGRLVESDDLEARLDALERAAWRWSTGVPSAPDARPGGLARARRRDAIPAPTAAVARSA